MISNIKWLLVIAMIGGPVMAFLGFQDGNRLSNLQDNGVEVEAYIEGATKTTGRRSGTSYDVDLVWQDSSGETRSAKEVKISSAFATGIIQGDQIVADTVKVLYLPDDASVKPALMGDLSAQLIRTKSNMQLGGVAGLVGLVGTILFFVLGRRRKQQG